MPPDANAPSTYAFYSWLRHGASTQIARRDGDAGNEPRATVTVHVGFNNDTLGVDVPLQLFGSGEVASVEDLSIVRTWPRPDAPDAEPNYFPLIEFRDADLPWRLTPASANDKGRLRPWLALVVLAADEFQFRPATAQGRLASVVVKDVASLPDPAQSWAWAHVQVCNQGTPDAQGLAALVAAGSGVITSRLMCPRRLDPRTRYTAFLVSALERGRLRGLQLEPGAVDGLAPAWAAGQAGGVTLPVWHHWTFHTEAEGDFESLVRRLQPRSLPAEVGIRPMDVSDPGGALGGVPAHDAPLGLEGALKSLQTVSTEWSASTTRSLFVDSLTALLNTPAQLLAGTAPVRAVAPPLYGARHAARDRLAPGQRPAWFHELNADPRLRTTAALGTQVVQADQRALMAGAWQQVQGILAENEARRRAQLARAVSKVAYFRHVVPAATEELIQFTVPLHARVKGSPVTIRALLRDSPVPAGVVDTAWRRVARPQGPIGRRQKRPGGLDKPSTLLDRLNTGALRPGAAPPVPASLPTLSGLAQVARPTVTPVPAQLWRTLFAWLLLLLVLLGVFALFGPLGLLVLAVAGYAVWRALPPAWRAALQALFRPAAPVPEPAAQAALDSLARGEFDASLVRDAAPNPLFRRVDAPPLGTPLTPPAAGPAAGAGDSDDAAAFRLALADLFTELGTAPVVPRPLVQVDLPELRMKLQRAVDPVLTIALPFRERVVFNDGAAVPPDDPIEPIGAYPKFPQPMYEALRRLGQDWLLPGLELIPTNTIALLVTNQRTVEAYMAGLNHEMGRELLWNEYPAELRGTYFRQFWDVRGVPVPAAGPEALMDITEMHAWKQVPPLGSNSARAPMPNGEERMVLLIRGDLFRRYPNTHVFAVNALAHPSGKRTMGDQVVNYEFQGKLDPDVVFFGFPLTPTQARGNPDGTDAGKPQGYFFVLQEQAAEPRFGLDADGSFGAAVASFDNLGWPHLAPDAGALQALRHIDLDRDLPNLGALDSGDNPAWHADRGLGRKGAKASHLADITIQKPVLIAVHASDMLPPGN